MSVKPRTVDNLGLEASIRYAKDKELYEPRLIEESKFISQKTEVPVAKPYVPSEFDQLFSSGKTALWASFEAPENFNFMKPLFTYQLIPSIGGSEKQENMIDRLEALESATDKEKRKRQMAHFQEDEEEGEKERKTLIQFFRCVQALEKTLMIVNARRNQYQKG